MAAVREFAREIFSPREQKLFLGTRYKPTSLQHVVRSRKAEQSSRQPWQWRVTARCAR